jgi:heat shock protein HtpX
MAMNFWEAQRKARSRTSLYLFIFIALTLLVAYFSEIAMRTFAAPNYHPPLPYVGLAFLAVTFCVAIFQYLAFVTQGGSYVAEAVGAVRVDPQHATMKEQVLLNIVKEVSLAASLPMPAVYILDVKEINAFAAGMNTQDAAITVTRGTLELLNRDELQGVIAHEFGHIYNGDMKISLRLAAMVMGFFFVLYLGLRLMQILQFQSDSRSDDRRGPNPILAVALIFLLAGAFTWFAGTILKSTVSRQREYLADACAVQFTRNPDGIANALRKIAKTQYNDMPKSGLAYSHLYLQDHSLLSSLFATHPPIEKRISAIENREYTPEEWQIPEK